MVGAEHSAEHEMPRPVAVELFCGAGGMSLGFEQAGFDVVAAFDNDPLHLATHSFNCPHTATLCKDVASLTVEDIVATARLGWRLTGRRGRWNGRVDCLLGGPSCQGFSEIGQMNVADPRNDLVYQFARIVRLLRPRYFVMENVPGFASPRYAHAVRSMLYRLRRSGYTIMEDGPVRLDASEFGVPQVRKRVFLIGARHGEGLPGKPLPSSAVVTVRDALGDLPDADRYEELLGDDEVRLRDRDLARLGHGSAYAKSMRDVGARNEDYGYRRSWQRRLLTSSGRTVHSSAVQRRLARLKPGDVEPISRLRRLDPRDQSRTLRAGTGRDHGSFTAARPIHFRYARVITVREAARLHSFPDWFRFHTTNWHGFRQVGNAVPPLLARHVAASLISAMEVAPSRPGGTISLGGPELVRMTMLQAATAIDYDVSQLPGDVRRNRD